MPTVKSSLNNMNSIAKGSERRVYISRDRADHLLKVMRKKHMRGLAQLTDTRFKHWLRIKRSYGVFLREQRAWTDAMLRASVRNVLPPLAGAGDFVLTEKGLGQLVEHIRTDTGETAPTLHDLAVGADLTEYHLDKLNTFVRELYDWHIPAYDLGPKNIVWQEEAERFILVDGFGDRAFIPLVTWFRAANNWKLDRAFEKTAARSPLHWNRKVRQFSKG